MNTTSSDVLPEPRFPVPPDVTPSDWVFFCGIDDVDVWRFVSTNGRPTSYPYMLITEDDWDLVHPERDSSWAVRSLHHLQPTLRGLHQLLQ